MREQYQEVIIGGSIVDQESSDPCERSSKNTLGGLIVDRKSNEQCERRYSKVDGWMLDR